MTRSLAALLITSLCSFGCAQEVLLAEADSPNPIAETPHLASIGVREARTTPTALFKIDQTTRIAAKWPETRILSLLHAKNQEAIAAGKLAQTRTTADDVRSLGQQLIVDHVASEDRVFFAARMLNVSLVPPDQIIDLVWEERGHELPATSIVPLASLSGTDFELALADWVQWDRHELSETIQLARPQVTDGTVRDMLLQTLPVLRKQEAMATRMLNKWPRRNER